MALDKRPKLAIGHGIEATASLVWRITSLFIPIFRTRKEQKNTIIEYMKDLESIYADMFREHEEISAARGCNQYKHVQGCQDAGGDTAEHVVPTNKQIQKLDWDLYEIEKDITLTLRAIRNTQSAKEKSTLKKRLQDLADERIGISKKIEKLYKTANRRLQ